jgi:glycerol-3-phosphate acyltransferase PlsY
MRSAGKVAGILAFLLDAAKGAVAAVLGLRFFGEGSALVPAAAATAVVGHMYPVWLGFRGGKGVATGAGALLPLAPQATLAGVLVFALTLAASRYVSVASMTAAVALAAAAFLTGRDPAVCWTAAALAVVIIFKHRGNLRRLAKGAESRVGGGRS